MAHRDVVTRFAPSPTGYLHIGGARTALFNWAFARHHGGTFILRLEDTDAVRSSTEAARAIVEDMNWLGMHWDEGPNPKGADPFSDQIGSFGPYCQSQRLDTYNELCERLLKSGAAFEENGAVRFRMPRHDITVHDLVLGEVTTPADKVEDLIIRKSDGFPTFHFANVIDDATMVVTHVIRAQEHLNNTHKHLALFEALDLKPPKYAHIPLIFNPDGSKMSKRDKAKAARAAVKRHLNGECDRDIWIEQQHEHVSMLMSRGGFKESVTIADMYAFIEGGNDDLWIAVAFATALGVPLPEIDVRDFRRSGYLPGALCNYVSLLGWNPGNDIEKFDSEFLVREFDLRRVGKSAARFDREKLLRFNTDAIASMSREDFAGTLRDHLMTYHPRFAWICDEQSRLDLFAAAYHDRSHTVSEPASLGSFFVRTPEYDAKAVEKVLMKGGGEGYGVLNRILPALQKKTDWTPETIETLLKQFAEVHQIGIGKVAQPIRVAVSGGTVTPPIGQTLALLGQNETVTRIQRCLLERSQ